MACGVSARQEELVLGARDQEVAGWGTRRKGRRSFGLKRKPAAVRGPFFRNVRPTVGYGRQPARRKWLPVLQDAWCGA